MTSATTDQIGGLTGSVAVKPPCRVATTANITLSGLQTIDGVLTVDGDRVLVKNQSTTTQNGIYVASSGTWQRSADFDGNRDVVKGTRIQVHSGTVGAGVYKVTTADPITIDSSAIVIALELSDDTAGDVTSLNIHFVHDPATSVPSYPNMARGVSAISALRSYKGDGVTLEDIVGAGYLGYPNDTLYGHFGLRTSTAFAGQWVGGQPMDKFAFREGIDRFSVNGLTSLFEVNDIPDAIFGTVPTRDGSRTLSKAMWSLAGDGLGQSYGWPLGRNNIMPDGAFGGCDNLMAETGDLGIGFPSSVGGWFFLDALGNTLPTVTTGWSWLGPGLRHTAGAGASLKARRRVLKLPAGESVTVKWTMANYSAGAAHLSLNGSGAVVDGTSRSSNATFTETLTPTGVTRYLEIVPESTTFGGDVTYVSMRSSGWNLENGWAWDETTGKPKHTPGTASKLWHTFDFTLASAVRLHEIETKIKTYTAGNVKIYFENDAGTVSVPVDTLKPNDKASSPARSYASPDEADGTAQTAAITSTVKRVQYITAPDTVDSVTRVVILASADFNGILDEVAAFIPQFAGGWGLSPDYGRADAVGHFSAQDAVTFGRGGGVYFGSTAENGLTTRRNTWVNSGRFVSAGLAGYKTAAVTYETMGFAVPAQFTAVCSALTNAEYGVGWIAAAGANALNTQDGLLTGLESLVWRADRLVNGTATKVLGIDTATGNVTIGVTDMVKFDEANDRLYAGLDSAAIVGSSTAFAQISTTGRTPLLLSRTEADAGIKRFVSFYAAGAETGWIDSDGAGLLLLTGYAAGHPTQADGFDPRKIEPGTLLSLSDEWCEWKMLEWTNTRTGKVHREPYFGSLAIGRSFIEEVEVVPARRDHAATDDGGLPIKVDLPAEIAAVAKTVIREPGGRIDKKSTVCTTYADPTCWGVTPGPDGDGEPRHLGAGHAFARCFGRMKKGDQLVSSGYDAKGVLHGRLGCFIALDQSLPILERMELVCRGAVKAWCGEPDDGREDERPLLVFPHAS